MAGVSPPADQGHDREAADHHEHVGEEVVQAPGDPVLGRHLQPHQDKPGVADGRVGQHPFDVALDDGDDRSDQEGEQGQGPDERLPVQAQDRERREEEPQEAGEAGRLRGGGHEARDRRGRALVDVGGPEVERDGRHLEPQADEQEGHAGEEQAVGDGDVLGEELRHLAEVGRSGGAIGEGDTVEKDGRRERPQHEVLDRRLTRLRAPSVVAGHHVQGDGEDLQAEEQHDQVVGTGHEHGARRRQHGQHVELGPVQPFPR